MKIRICDLCKKKGKLTEAKGYMRIKGLTECRIDYCDKCKKELPKDKIKFIKLSYSLDGIEITDKQAQEFLGMRKQ